MYPVKKNILFKLKFQNELFEGTYRQDTTIYHIAQV